MKSRNTLLFGLAIFFSFSCLANEHHNSASSLDSIKYAINVFWNKTSCRGPMSERTKAMGILQKAADNCSDTTYRKYLYSNDPQYCSQMEKSGMLYYYKAAFDKVNREIDKTHVKKGTVAVWLIYNMGYIVKTPTHCFAIDVNHKYSYLLANKIDFLLITHHHPDHYSKVLIDAMSALGKPVVSNFIDNDYKVTGTRDFKMGDITIHANLADHNTKYLNFVVTYEIDCGEATNHFTLMHIGDTYNASQLKSQGAIDLFIPHLAVGLDMRRAFDIVQPKAVLLSHLLELSHHVTQWRWSYQYGIDQVNALQRPDTWIPVWGEKMIFKKSK
jgi:hypothetical protein